MAEKSKIVINQGFSDINPLICGEEQCVSGHSYGPAARSYWLLHYVVSGKGVFTSPRGTFSVSKGEIFIIRPYEITFYQADTSEPWKYIWIGFTSDKALPTKLDAVISCPEAAGIFSEMKRCEKMSRGRSAFLSARLWDLFAQLLKSEKQPIDYVEKALHCIHSEYMEFG